MPNRVKATLFLDTRSQSIELRSLTIRDPRPRRPNFAAIVRARFKRNEPAYRLLVQHGD
mgnify:CR=1 FL=1